jgi:hypothetical protein
VGGCRAAGRGFNGTVGWGALLGCLPPRVTFNFIINHSKEVFFGKCIYHIIRNVSDGFGSLKLYYSPCQVNA